MNANQYDTNHEMSVEEILLSIRNVINNRPNAHHTKRKSEPEIYDDVLELTEEHNVPLSNDNDETLVTPSNVSKTSETLHDFIERATFAHSNDSHKPAETMEALVVKMLKPQLAKWLNTHLPSIVKELVEQELKRITPRGH